METCKTIISPICDLKKQPTNTSNLESQLLFGEKIKVIERNKNWAFCQSKVDNYKGWIEINCIGDYPKPNYKVKELFTIVYSKPNIKSKRKYSLPFNSKIFKINDTNDWTKILINKTYGYVYKNHIIGINYRSKNIIKYIEYFLDIPYLLGGKSYMGIDCSGLVQLCLNFNGIEIPRNTIDQIDFKSEYFEDLEKLEKNCLIFWDGHVAISKSKNVIIHSNAYHMKVKKETLQVTKKRLIKNDLFIKKIKKLNLH